MWKIVFLEGSGWVCSQRPGWYGWDLFLILYPEGCSSVAAAWEDRERRVEGFGG